MIPVAEARRIVLAAATPLADLETIPLERARGRCLGSDIRADADYPPFTRSAMDGFAVAEPPRPGGFRLLGTIAAGAAPGASLNVGEAWRIFTGAPVPAGATRVVPQEEAIVTGEDVQVTRTSTELYWREAGEDFRLGDLLLRAGETLGAVPLSVLASIGHSAVAVRRRPRVLHLTSGDELVPPDQTPGPGQIRDSNSILVRALVEEARGELADHTHVPDRPQAATEAVRALPNDWDLLLISGGASVGAHDFSAETLIALGFTLHFRQVNLRPGKPLIFATRGRQLAFALPGNPVSHFVTFHLFVRGVLARLAGESGEPQSARSKLAVDFSEPPNRRETYWPVRGEFKPGGTEVTPLPWNSSGHLASLLPTTALLKISANSPPLPKGELVEVLLVH